MHEKYGKDGLVVLTVTMDEATEDTQEERAQHRKSVETFLTKAKLPFRTYNLDFDPKKPPPTLAFTSGVPRVFVFNRDNQYLLRLPVVDKDREVVTDVTEAAIEKAIAEAVKK
jgi:hypothetical protein